MLDYIKAIKLAESSLSKSKNIMVKTKHFNIDLENYSTFNIDFELLSLTMHYKVDMELYSNILLPKTLPIDENIFKKEPANLTNKIALRLAYIMYCIYKGQSDKVFLEKLSTIARNYSVTNIDFTALWRDSYVIPSCASPITITGIKDPDESLETTKIMDIDDGSTKASLVKDSDDIFWIEY